MADQPHTYQQIKILIKQFTGQANTLTIPRVFIDLTGDHIAALLLSQILYWQDRTEDDDGWFYKTGDEWEQELGLTYAQVKRASRQLEKFGVETKLRKVRGAPRTHYRVNYAYFVDLILKFLENQESRKSTKLKVDFQESRKSMDIKETSKSLMVTETTQRVPAESETRAHFAVIAYQATFGVWPSAPQGAAIAAEVRDASVWQHDCKLFYDNGWKPLVGNLLDRYKKDIAKAGTNGTHQSNRPRTAHPNAPSRHGYAIERLDNREPDDTS